MRLRVVERAAMTLTQRLELLATARVGNCALRIDAECGDELAFAVYRGAIRALVSAACAVDYEGTRALIREIEDEHFVPSEAKQIGRKLHYAVSNTGEVAFR